MTPIQSDNNLINVTCKVSNDMNLLLIVNDGYKL